MEILSLLDDLQHKALRDRDLRHRLLETRNEKEPIEAFCKICQEYGFPIYEMDLICAGEDCYASMKRSTNGGGENSPMQKWGDDYYELFLASLEE